MKAIIQNIDPYTNHAGGDVTERYNVTIIADVCKDELIDVLLSTGSTCGFMHEFKFKLGKKEEK